jgi:gluconolactonase
METSFSQYRLIPFMRIVVLSFVFHCIAFGFLSSVASAQDSVSLIADNAQLQKISGQFAFTEGPAADKKGNVYFTDQPNNKIWKYSTDGKLSVFMDNAGRSNGMYFDKKGNLVTCADEKNELWRISPKGKVTVLMRDLNGHKLNGPNDLWIHPQGRIYFTDPYYQRGYWERKSPDTALGGEKIYYLPAGKAQPVLANDQIKKPNGIVGTPDGKLLYVADIGDRKVLRYNINADGSLSNRMVFAENLTDGMTLDEQGNLYLAGNGVTVFNKEGKKIQQISIPSRWTANVCFGGKDRNLLFITASESVYMLPMKVKGAR